MSKVDCQMSNVKCQMFKKGFTLIEIILSIAIITVITGIGIPVYQSFQNRNDLDIATVTFVQNLRRAQVLAQSVDGDANWGVIAQSENIILFKGDSFNNRDSSFDEVYEVSPSITFSGTEEYVFNKFTGFPQATGSLTLTSLNNETRTITINEKGMADY